MDITHEQALAQPRRPSLGWTGKTFLVLGGLVGGIGLTLCLCASALLVYSMYYSGRLGAADGLITTGGGQIEFGETVSAEMPSLDQAHNWAFHGQVGQRVEISVVGYGSDPYVRLIGPDGKVIIQNDDSAATLNAHIVTTLPASGNYTVRISVWTPGEYSLLLED